VEQVSYSAFQAAVDNCVDPDCRRALKALADLFALRCIEQDMIFRNDEYVAPAKVGEHDCYYIYIWLERMIRERECETEREGRREQDMTFRNDEYVAPAKVNLGSE
jgi:hypothetical protein